MLVKIAGMVVINSKGNVAGVVQMDTVAEKVGPLEMDVMDRMVVITSMLVFFNRLESNVIMMLDVPMLTKTNV